MFFINNMTDFRTKESRSSHSNKSYFYKIEKEWNKKNFRYKIL